MIEKCDICNKTFSCRGSLNRHLVDIHHVKPYLKSDEDTNIYNFIFYMHTCVINNKRYIGATTQSSIDARWKNGKGYGFNNEFAKDILKYGVNSFKHEELSRKSCTISEAKIIEENYIKALKPEYNKTIRGIKIISPNATKAMQNKMKKDPTFGKEKVKDCLKWQKSHPDEMQVIHKKRIEAGAKARQHKVICIDTGIIYESITKAAKATNCNSSKISECCLGTRNHTNNLHWKYCDYPSDRQG